MLIGAPAVGTIIASWGFWVLMLIAWARGDLYVRGTLAFIGLWVTGRIASAYVLYGLLFAPYVAILDIALVFVVFKGDVRLR
jgi:hypothetical protein